MSLVPARRPGWLLEGRGNPSPRGMVAHPLTAAAKAVDRTRLTGPLALLFPCESRVQIFLVRLGSCLRRSTFSLYRSHDAEAEEIG